MTWHIMVAEIFIKNRFDALLRPIVGINYDRNAPLIKADDTWCLFGSWNAGAFKERDACARKRTHLLGTCVPETTSPWVSPISDRGRARTGFQAS
jgi:hypothetical protein